MSKLSHVLIAMAVAAATFGLTNIVPKGRERQPPYLKSSKIMMISATGARENGAATLKNQETMTPITTLTVMQWLSRTSRFPSYYLLLHNI